MIIFPAIDIINGKVVRLTEGDYNQKKNYSITPLEAAENFYNKGARYLHLVDLDGAKSGNADNAKTIESIIKEFNMFVEVGGGIRSIDQIKKYVDCGASRIILGTVAIKNFYLVEKAVNLFGEKIAVGVDAKENKVCVNGWTEITDIDSLEFCKRLKSANVSNVIYTDISKDGKQSGTNLDVYKVLCQTYYPKITASGGISNIKEIEILRELGIYAAILGKALYEKTIDLSKAIEAAKGNQIC